MDALIRPATEHPVQEINTTTDTRDYLAKSRHCLLYTSPSPRDATLSRMPSSA